MFKTILKNKTVQGIVINLMVSLLKTRVKLAMASAKNAKKIQNDPALTKIREVAENAERDDIIGKIAELEAGLKEAQSRDYDYGHREQYIKMIKDRLEYLNRALDRK